MKALFLLVFVVGIAASACKKEKNADTPNTPVPFLTGKKWTFDTLTIDLPVTFSLLSTEDQQNYRNALRWYKNAQLTFNEDGSVTTGGDYDFGYLYWKLINNNADIEVAFFALPKETLLQWSADSQRFSYSRRITPSFSCRHFFK